MARFGRSKDLHRWTKEFRHAFVWLIIIFVISILLGQFAFIRGWEVIYRGLLRFFRITFFLCVSLLLLSPIFGNLSSIMRRKKEIFVQVTGKQHLEIRPVKHWLFRPFQGIGIGLLFATKLLSVLQVVTGSNTKTPLFLPRGQFELGRLLIATGITILVALLLSTLWTMDDLGIRYFNRKDYEIKMVGKYVGTLMPIIFGLYGVLSLFGEFPKVEALLYLSRVIIILYPPFAVFSVFHGYFVRRKAEDLSKRLNVEKTSILH